MSSSTPNSSSSSRKGKGRKKVNLAKIENEANLQVTFSKRRAGVFKKASEISTLCGAETAVVVFSPSNKAHSFGHPSVEAIANRFINQTDNGVNVIPPPAPPAMSDAEKFLEAHRAANARHQATELCRLEREVEEEKRRAIKLRKDKAAFIDINQLNYEQLSQLKDCVLGFQRQFEAKVMAETMGMLQAPSVFSMDPGGPNRGGPEPENAAEPEVGEVADVPMIPYSSIASSSTVNADQKP